MSGKTQDKCPYCGSRDTAEILYGYPAFDEQLNADLEAGRVHIGGCTNAYPPFWEHFVRLMKRWSKGAVRN